MNSAPIAKSSLVPDRAAAPEPHLYTMPVIGRERSVGTRQEALRLLDRSSHLAMWVNKIEGGTVEHKPTREKVTVDTIHGPFPAVAKVADEFIVRPTWPSADSRMVTVKLRVSYREAGGGEIPLAQRSGKSSSPLIDTAELEIDFFR